MSHTPLPPSPAPIASPCVKRCAVHPEHRLCTGCGRALEEIAAWSSLTPQARADIMAQLPLRLARLAPPTR